jgi:ABC-type nitrate/sulfonate/bicarbonate transport system permease component
LIQFAHSLGRVGLGFLLATLVAVPTGFLIGMSPLMRRAEETSQGYRVKVVLSAKFLPYKTY